MIKCNFHKKRWLGFGCKVCIERLQGLLSIIVSIEVAYWELYMNYTRYNGK